MDFEKRSKALRILKLLSLLQLLTATLVLILGGVSSQQHGEAASGIPPYYSGVFIVGPIAVITAILGMAIYFRGRHCYSKSVAVQKIGCLMRAYCISIPFNWLGGFIAVLIASLTGICTVSECSYIEHAGRNYRLAVTIVAFILLLCVFDVVGLALICIYANHFGIRLISRRHNRVSNDLPDATHSAIYATSNDNLVSTYQLQNQLLQNQVTLNNLQTRQNEVLQLQLLQNDVHPQRNHLVNRHLTYGDPEIYGLPPEPPEEWAWSRPVTDTPSVIPNIPVDDGHDDVIDSSNQERQEGNEVSAFQEPVQDRNEHEHRRQRIQHVEYGQDVRHEEYGQDVQHVEYGQDVQHAQRRHIIGQRPHRKKKKRRKVRPSHPEYDGKRHYALPPIVIPSVPPPSPSPPPPPNTPPPEMSLGESPPPYFVNEDIHVHYVTSDPPPPYVP